MKKFLDLIEEVSGGGGKSKPIPTCSGSKATYVDKNTNFNNWKKAHFVKNGIKPDIELRTDCFCHGKNIKILMNRDLAHYELFTYGSLTLGAHLPSDGARAAEAEEEEEPLTWRDVTHFSGKVETDARQKLKRELPRGQFNQEISDAIASQNLVYYNLYYTFKDKFKDNEYLHVHTRKGKGLLTLRLLYEDEIEYKQKRERERMMIDKPPPTQRQRRVAKASDSEEEDDYIIDFSKKDRIRISVFNKDQIDEEEQKILSG